MPSWYNKEHTTWFDSAKIDGLFFSDGNLVQPVYKEWAQGMKSPRIEFPSGEQFEIWDEYDPHVHLYRGMDLPFFSTYKQALQQATEQAEDAWFTVFGNGIDELELWSGETEKVYFVTYDDQVRQLTDIVITAA